MPCYKVFQRSVKGERTRVKVIEAPSEIIARADADTARGWVTTQVLAIAETPLNRTRARVRFVMGKPLIRMCRTIASMLKANIVINDALKFYIDGIDDAGLKRTMDGILRRINSGERVADAFEKSGRFDDVFIGLIRAGSDSGSLAQAFRSIADRTEQVMNFRSRLKKAIQTPLICITLVVIAFVSVQVLFIPTVERSVQQTGQPPDLFSSVIFSVSHFLQAFWWVLLLLVLVIGGMLIFSKPTREALLQWLMKRSKVLHNMIMGFRQLLFVGSMDMLTNNGIDVLGALSTSIRVVKGLALESELKMVYERHKNGIPLSQAVERFTSCDKAVVHLIRVGEKSGTLEEQFSFLRVMYEELTSDAMDVFVEVSRVVMLFIALNLIVGMFVSVYLPIIFSGLSSLKSVL